MDASSTTKKSNYFEAAGADAGTFSYAVNLP